MGAWRGGWQPLGPLPLLLAVLLTTLSWTSHIFVGASSTLPEQVCDLQGCWELFQAAQATLGVRDEYPPPRAYTPTPQDLRARCISLRTFSQCIEKMLRECRGDLNYHSAQKGAERQMKHFNCSQRGEVFNRSQIPPSRDDLHPSVCSYGSSSEEEDDEPVTHRHCGLFGDPHLRTFFEEFQTCRVQGAWPLLDNAYLTVQVTNEAVGDKDSHATATTKVTVIVKKHEECAAPHFVTYQAQAGVLPDAFDDGRTHLGPDRSVSIKEVTPGAHVEIYLRYIDTTLVLRQFGRYFSFAAKMPEPLIRESMGGDLDGVQLCVRGCPRAERIDFREVLAHKRQRLRHLNAVGGSSSSSSSSSSSQLDNTGSRVQDSSSGSTIVVDKNAALTKCREANVTDFYFDSCVFDLMTTGDINFTLAANRALRDALRLFPKAAEKHQHRTSLSSGLDKDYRSSTHASAASLVAHGLVYIHRTSFVLLACILAVLCADSNVYAKWALAVL